MKYLSTKEAAQRWGISQRRVSILASQGRIEGAKLVANRWLIPENANKPDDFRSSNKKTDGEKYVFPFIIGCVNSEEQIKNFTPEEAELYKLCTVYEAGDFATSRKIAEKLLKSKNRYIRIGALYHLPVICMYTQDFEMINKYFILFKTEILNSSEHAAELKLILDALSSELVSAYDYEVSFDSNSPSDYPAELMPLIAANVLFADLVKLASGKEAHDVTPYEFICQTAEADGYYFYAMLIHTYLGLYNGYSGNAEKEYNHLKRAIDIGLKHNTLFTLAFTASSSPDTLGAILQDYPPEIAEKFYKLTRTFIDSRNNYIEYKGSGPKLADISDEDYRLIFYCLKSYSVEKMAEMQGLSVSGMKKRLARLYDKLGVNNKIEIATNFYGSAINLENN